jgi:hypothetical protein
MGRAYDATIGRRGGNCITPPVDRCPEGDLVVQAPDLAYAKGLVEWRILCELRPLRDALQAHHRPGANRPACFRWRLGALQRPAEGQRRTINL